MRTRKVENISKKMTQRGTQKNKETNVEHVTENDRKWGEQSKEEKKNSSSAFLTNIVVHTYIYIHV